MRNTVCLRCPAKVNLFLEVLGKRADGYHEIATLMAPVSLYDTLELAAAERDVMEVEPGGAAPADRTNTAWKAIDALRRSHAVPPLRIRLRKRIPSGAGLGGGSSDAAGAVRAANGAFGLGLSVADESAVLALVGSDTAFFAHGGWAECTGRGEVVRPVAGRRLLLVIVAPPFECLTRDVYARYRRAGPRRRRGWFNRLEEPAFALRPELARIKREMSRLPFARVQMTGSGSAIFGVCRDARAQKRLAAECRKAGWGKVFAVRTLDR